MKTFQWQLSALLFVCIAQMTSCTKSIDNVSDESVSQQVGSDATLAGEFPTCKLRRIYHDHGGVPGYLISGLFTYNSAGNPVSLTYEQGGTGNSNNYFFYDKQNRLREYRISYSPDDMVEALTHRYGYNSLHQIVEDTLFNVGADENGELFFQPVIFYTNITYDSQGRVIKETVKRDGFPTRNPTYTYDARGNLAVAGWKSSSYDNKVSLMRAHPVFQFIHRNYSNNNPAPQAKYNSKGLPLSWAPSNDQFFAAYPTNIGGSGIVKAVYDCQ